MTAELTLPAAPIEPWPGEQIALGGRRLFVRRSGSGGDPAVMVHGLGGASTNWTDLMYLLRGRFDCWAPDLPGFGRSEPPPENDYSLDSHVRAITRLCEHVAAETGGPVHLLGNSLGGASAVRIAAMRPDLVRTLSLISPAMPVIVPRRGTDPRLIFLLLPGLSQLATRMSRNQTARQRVQAVLDLCYADPSSVPQVRIDEAVIELDRRRGLPWFETAMMASLRGLAASYLRRGPASLWTQAGLIQAPTLVLWGRHDRLVSVTLAGRTQQAIPGARLVVLEDAGHVAQLEHPVRVAREFLALTGIDRA
ncbi:alpha/beta fold hydrolase [Acidothermaceae bacterium B102]|nr:alpha/beta fold hydrolase [Acidothermaceae bacterium B102]